MSITSNEVIKNSKCRFLRISSEDKATGNNTRFTVDIGQSGGIIDNVFGFIIHSIECPNVFNNITTNNNNYQVGFGGPATETDLDLNVPVGYYLIDDLISIMNAQISAQIAINGDTYTFVLSKVGIFPNERIQIDVNGLSAGSCNLFSSDNTIWENLGIFTTPNAIPPNTPVTIVNGVPYVSPYIPNLIGETAVYVHSRTLAPNHLVEGSGSFSVVDKLNLDNPFGSVCYSNFNNDSTHFKKYFPFETLKSIRTVDITLRNRTGQVLEMPPNFNFTMMVTLFYK
ncbi:MAG: hypothetical protein ACW980_25510 [Promethearchaeota archaeon]|jgi:hypothetical protein